MGSHIRVSGLTKHFAGRRSLTQLLRGEAAAVRAVDGVAFDLAPGEAVGLLGESGCGKTTTGRLLLKLDEPTAGTIHVDGTELRDIRGEALRSFRQHAQLVFQNPFDALNPRMTVRRSMAEPLINARIPRAEQEGRIRRALDRVHLRGIGDILEKYPHQLSGGQLQRVVLGRALILDPRFIVADEPVSMLDVSVRAGILNLMREIQAESALTAIYISHDLALVRYVAQRTLVMYLGAIVEDGPTSEVITAPLHPYTRALIAAVPVPHVDQPRGRLPIKGSISDQQKAHAGCRFAERCPAAIARCTTEAPALRDVAPARRVACHLV
jgi:oligopeptide/dipeptide ABC transporter ATP-binding protein